ncbi:hypothetical protein [Pseudomonas sp. AB12(2023)]|uniref:hypothetical protein n=1 Tax=Pseudomonas sp. AB12(2023) TaxID=3048597 RepID=UPI002B222C0F|nr:hypothetical protein [Pseudomonas sp. AB12(2023)]MEB0221335.1 hypothetical protein [Pseudomonas sp. AB12(2023)]
MMNSKNEPVDVFDMSRATGPDEPLGAPIDPPNAVVQGANTKTFSFLAKHSWKSLMPLVAIGGLVIVGSVFIFFPDSKSAQQAVHRPSPAIEKINSEVVSSARTDSSKPGPELTEQTVQTSVDPIVESAGHGEDIVKTPLNAIFTANAPSSIVPEPQDVKMFKVDSRITNLEEKVTLLEAQVAKNGRATINKELPTNRHGTAREQVKKIQVSSGIHKAAASKSDRPLARTPIVPDSVVFTLNTIYPGQAWIQDSERTYAVKSGDYVAGIKILKIDTQQRLIQTDHGNIR